MRPAGPPETVAEVRAAVRRALVGAGCPPGTPVVVACSGGADSMALADAAAYLAAGAAGRRGGAATGGGAGAAGGWPVTAAVVDHGLQDGSGDRAAATVALLGRLGVPARVYPVEVAGPGGTEAAARRARYAALLAARPTPDSPVLLGHTLDDQAETVLLGLGRGSGARSIAGMATWDPPWLRPLLTVRRSSTLAACRARGIEVWHDPHNEDPRFTRVRLRHEVLPLMEDVLAGGVAEALARTAAQLAEDGAALDAAAALVRAAAAPPPAGGDLDASVLAGHPPAVRRRVLRGWLLDSGVRELSDAQLRAADDLVGRWRGQGGIALPGGLELTRRHGRLLLRPTLHG